MFRAVHSINHLGNSEKCKSLAEIKVRSDYIINKICKLFGVHCTEIQHSDYGGVSRHANIVYWNFSANSDYDRLFRVYERTVAYDAD